MIFSHIKRSFLFLIPQKYLPKENKMFTCNSYLNDVITYRASHYSLSQVLFQVLAILADIKADMESCQLTTRIGEKGNY